MAKRSKTQKAKASAARQARKADRELETVEVEEASTDKADAEAEAEKKGGLLKRSKDTAKPEKAEAKGSDAKKSEKAKPKKKRFQFLRDVKGELQRVTWPSKKDVGQWTGVVVAALLFFGIYVAILDNFIITPALIGVSSIEVEQTAPKVESADDDGNVGLQTTDSSAEGAVEGDVATDGEAVAGDALATEATADGAADAAADAADTADADAQPAEAEQTAAEGSEE